MPAESPIDPHNPNPTNAPTNKGKSGVKWWNCFGLGLLMAAVAVYLYYDLTRFEQEGGKRRLNILLAWAYDLGGKWGPVGVMGFSAVVCFLAGLFVLYERSDDSL